MKTAHESHESCKIYLRCRLPLSHPISSTRAIKYLYRVTVNTHDLWTLIRCWRDDANDPSTFTHTPDTCLATWAFVFVFAVFPRKPSAIFQYRYDTNVVDARDRLSRVRRWRCTPVETRFQKCPALVPFSHKSQSARRLSHCITRLAETSMHGFSVSHGVVKSVNAQTSRAYNGLVLTVRVVPLRTGTVFFFQRISPTHRGRYRALTVVRFRPVV